MVGDWLSWSRRAGRNDGRVSDLISESDGGIIY